MSKKENHINLKKGMKLMCLDVGKKRTGIAVCDPDWMVVTPLQTLNRTKFTQDALLLINLIKERQIDGLVIGLPLNMDDSEGPMCQSIRDFVLNLQKLDGFPNLPIAFQDERLTSHKAETMLIDDLDLSRAKRKKVLDQLAAVKILEDFIFQQTIN